MPRRFTVRGLAIVTAAAVGVGVLAPVIGHSVAQAAEAGSSISATPIDKQSDRYRGINVAGAEFTSAGTLKVDGADTYRFLESRGYSLVRIPFLWESVQPTLDGDLSASALSALHTAVDAAGDAGLRVVLDVHDYGAYRGVAYGADGSFTQTDFADLWRRLSLEFLGDPAVVGYGLMNEPRSLPAVDGVSGNIRWQRAQQAAVDAIRATGDRTTIIVSGYTAASIAAWTNATNGQPTPYIVDPLDDIRWEAHQYWDADSSGRYTTTYADAVATGWGSGQSDRLRSRVVAQIDAWTAWLTTYHQKGFFGEFGWPSSERAAHPDDAASWDALADLALSRIDATEGDLVWTAAWATGTRWSAGYALQPYGSVDGALATPLSNAVVLERHLGVAPSALPVADAEATEPTGASTEGPTAAPSAEPTPAPTPAGTDAPAPEATPTDEPTVVPTANPGPAPTATATPTPTPTPTASPTPAPAKAAARMAAWLSPATSVKRGASTTVVARVVASGATPKGTVVVYNGSTRLGSASLVNGTARIRFTVRLSAGPHSLAVVYAGSSTVTSAADRGDILRVLR